LKSPIVPKAQKRARSRIAGNGKRQFVQVYKDEDQRNEEENFKAMLYRQLPDGFHPIQGAVKLDVVALMPIPSSSGRKYASYAMGFYPHIKKPDLDNLVKQVKDCCKGSVWIDDKQVISLKADKMYSDAPGWVIKLEW
jgi:Holliday junction resolvase RusA-like endonuclease